MGIMTDTQDAPAYRCSRCKERPSLPRSYYCRECASEKMREWRKKNPGYEAKRIKQKRKAAAEAVN